MSKNVLLKLDPIERNCVALLCQGLTVAEAADVLRVAPGSVYSYLSTARRVLECSTNYQLVAKFCGYSQEAL